MNILFWAGALIMVTAWGKAASLILEGKRLYEKTTHESEQVQTLDIWKDNS